MKIKTSLYLLRMRTRRTTYSTTKKVKTEEIMICSKILARIIDLFQSNIYDQVLPQFVYKLF